MKQAGKDSTDVLDVNQAAAEYSANSYVREALGLHYRVTHAVCDSASWRFLIQCRWSELDSPIPVGHLQVDAQTGKVVTLGDDDLQDMRERAALFAARERGELPRDENGVVLPYLAKIRVNGYMGSEVIFFAQVEGRPKWVAGDPPRWRVATVLRLPNHGRVCELGAVDVNALTGEVIPLTAAQIRSMQRKASDAAARAQRSAAAAG